MDQSSRGTGPRAGVCPASPLEPRTDSEKEQDTPASPPDPNRAQAAWPCPKGQLCTPPCPPAASPEHQGQQESPLHASLSPHRPPPRECCTEAWTGRFRGVAGLAQPPPGLTDGHQGVAVLLVEVGPGLGLAVLAAGQDPVAAGAGCQAHPDGAATLVAELEEGNPAREQAGSQGAPSTCA